ncbi:MULTISPECIES: RraA family protein [unclassified Streptomyces]|uniref:RraA family protein n=1 Tax=unclassified Streptomyces TaxID=2593676 RepID=UPI001660808D|nr:MULTISPECIES: RraA family protein [unclassified Streptomyces]MBD0708892.1 demethylmenaquinone methyltransferase [Streptomyces sp. CBMA291]MBD0715991.1 demethylmenaquinone methyltransferase [Streptomyces sp. CBMA370]
MPLDLRELPAPLDTALAERLRTVDFPTLGHYLEEGFCAPALQRQAGEGKLVGRAVTVRTTATDSTVLHHAAGLVGPGDVLVVDTGGDRRHAPLGEVLVNALASRGAAGAVVDGLCTDIDALRKLGLPVYAYGRTPLTTKLHGLADGALCAPVVCGGVPVHAGDLVLGDANGLIIAPAGRLAAVLDEAIEDDAQEPALVAELWEGKPLGSLTGATETLRRLNASA